MLRKRLAQCLWVAALMLGLAGGIAPAQAQSGGTPAAKPNILVIFGDDIGYWNVSAYNRGMMGYRTPNIDRIAREGAIFTDYYGQQSCTAGRAAFLRENFSGSEAGKVNVDITLRGGGPGTVASVRQFGPVEATARVETSMSGP